MVNHRHASLVRAVALGVAAAALLSGCSSIKKSIDRINNSVAASSDLQSFIQERLTTKFHRSVRSVSCTPHVDQVLQGDSANLTCVVRFTGGSSYTTPGTITDPSTDPDYVSYTFSFNDPPSVDITTAPLPQPAVTLAAKSPASLFVARNLSPVVKRLITRFGSHDLIIQMAIYPGELEAVIAASGGRARAVSAPYSGALTVGSPVSFSGSRSGIAFSQLVPGVIEHLSQLITAKGGVPLSDIDRFVLSNSLPGNNSGWNIYLTSGTTHFQALVRGDRLVKITPNGTSALN